MKKLKVLDLFSGLGGFSLGLERTGHFETVAFCDNNKFSKAILNKHWKGIKIYDDVRAITKENFETDGIETPDIITGGFPCQPFSVAGKQKGTDDDRHLWPEMFRIIKVFQPKFVIGENVPGIVNIQDGVVFETVCTDLESQGYEVQPFNIPAAAVGAPHQRKRIWIIANLADTNSERSQRYGKEYKLRENSQKIKASRSSTSKRDQTDVANTESSLGNDVQTITGTSKSKTQEVSRNGSSVRGESSWWHTEPNVGRVAHGVSGRVYRLKGLGNSIVPQIAEEIGRAIIKAMK